MGAHKFKLLSDNRVPLKTHLHFPSAPDRAALLSDAPPRMSPVLAYESCGKDFLFTSTTKSRLSNLSPYENAPPHHCHARECSNVLKPTNRIIFLDHLAHVFLPWLIPICSCFVLSLSRTKYRKKPAENSVLGNFRENYIRQLGKTLRSTAHREGARSCPSLQPSRGYALRSMPLHPRRVSRPPTH